MRTNASWKLVLISFSIILTVVFFIPMASNATPTVGINQTENSTDQLGQQGQNWTTYEDPILGISIQHPPDYEVKEAPGGVLFSSSSFLGLPPMDSPSSPGLLEASIDVMDLPPEVDTAQKFMRQMMNEQRKYDTNILAMNETTLSGNNPAYRTVYTTYTISQVMDFFTVKEGTGYYLSFSVMPPERFDNYTDEMQRMSESFRILG